MTFDGERWTGGDGSEWSVRLLDFLNEIIRPRHSMLDPYDLEAVSAALAYVGGEILKVTGEIDPPPPGAIY
jgi:hypothetical protein